MAWYDSEDGSCDVLTVFAYERLWAFALMKNTFPSLYGTERIQRSEESNQWRCWGTSREKLKQGRNWTGVDVSTHVYEQLQLVAPRESRLWKACMPTSPVEVVRMHETSHTSLYMKYPSHMDRRKCFCGIWNQLCLTSWCKHRVSFVNLWVCWRNTTKKLCCGKTFFDRVFIYFSIF